MCVGYCRVILPPAGGAGGSELSGRSRPGACGGARADGRERGAGGGEVFSGFSSALGFIASLARYHINNHAILFPNLIIITALLTGAPHATFPMPTETPLISKVTVWLVYPRWKHTRSYLVQRDSRLETGVSPGCLAVEPSRIRFTQYCFGSRYSSVFSPDAIRSYHFPLRTRCNVFVCFIVFYFLMF